MSKYIWAWGYDGTVMYVYEVYKPWWSRFHKLKQVKHFYTQDFTDVRVTAENLVNRLNAPLDRSEDKA